MARRDAAAALNNQLFARHDIEGGHVTLQAL